MGNSGEERFRERLEGWVAGDDAVLAGAAQWALDQLAASKDVDREGGDSRASKKGHDLLEDLL